MDTEKPGMKCVQMLDKTTALIEAGQAVAEMGTELGFEAIVDSALAASVALTGDNGEVALLAAAATLAAQRGADEAEFRNAIARSALVYEAIHTCLRGDGPEELARLALWPWEDTYGRIDALFGAPGDGD